jgi:O-antigen/teichoic acid export membrane protein
VALTDFDRIQQGKRAFPAQAVARVRGWLSDHSHSGLAQRVASAAFLIRVVSAAVIYLSQVLLARWMGTFEFGIYVYVWTWVLLFGGLFDLGLAQGAQRFIPEYIERKQPDLLRGFLSGSRWLVAGVATIAAVLAAGSVFLIAPWIDDLACICLPLYALRSVQDGIGRSFNWVGLSLLPPYILRPLLLLVFLGVPHAAGFRLEATGALLALVASLWVTTIAQAFLLNSKLRGAVPSGPKSYEIRTWLATSLPIFMVEGFYLLLTYADIIMLEQIRGPHEVAIYYAAAKTLALVAFVNFSVSAAVAHRFSEYHVSGERERLADFLAQSIRWTFWPSLAATCVILALGQPFLHLFGPDFSSGYPIMFVLAFGLVARAAVGPVERLLNMLGQQKLCATVYGFAFALNVLFGLLLIPRYGGMGAAAGTAAALAIESVLLFYVTKRRLGLHVFIWRRRPVVSP